MQRKRIIISGFGLDKILPPLTPLLSVLVVRGLTVQATVKALHPDTICVSTNQVFKCSWKISNTGGEVFPPGTKLSRVCVCVSVCMCGLFGFSVRHTMELDCLTTPSGAIAFSEVQPFFLDFPSG